MYNVIEYYIETCQNFAFWHENLSKIIVITELCVAKFAYFHNCSPLKLIL